METSIFAMIGYGLTAVTSLIAFSFWRRQENSHKELNELQGRTNQAFHQVQTLETSQQKLRDELELKSRKLAKFEKDKKDSFDRLKTAEKLASQQEATWKSQLQTLENKVAHHQAQTEAITKQLSEVDKEKAEIRAQLSELEQKEQKKSSNLKAEILERTKELKSENKDLQQKIKSQQNEVKRMRDTLSQVKPDDVKRMKRKVAQYQHFYNAMKQQKELVEERNQNWEKALHLLADAILNEKNQNLEAGASIGKKVSCAMEVASLPQLVQDEFSSSRQ